MTNKISQTICAGVLLLSALAPSTLLAQGQAPDAALAGFCASLDEFSAAAAARMKSGEAAYSAKRAERDGMRSERTVMRGKMRSTYRDEWDARKEEIYAALLARAATDREREAVRAFRASVDAAVAARRAAVDAAVAELAVAVNIAIAERDRTVRVAIDAFRRDASAALLRAKNDCAAGADPALVGAGLRSALRDARERFRAAVAALPAHKDALLVPALSRRDAALRSIADFHVTIERLKAELAAAFRP